MNRQQVKDIFSKNPDFPHNVDLLLLVIDYCDNLVPKKEGQVLAELVHTHQIRPLILLNLALKDAFRLNRIEFIKEVLDLAGDYCPQLNASDLHEMLAGNSYNALIFALENNYVTGDIKECQNAYQAGHGEANTATHVLSSYLLCQELGTQLESKQTKKTRKSKKTKI